MADASAFNLQTNEKAARKLLVTAINVGDSITAQSGTPKWQVVGAGVEDSAIELNPDVETVTDILGITETTVNKLETAQTLDPMTIRGGSDLALKLHNLVKNKEYAKLSMFEVMIIFAYIGDDTNGYEAEVHENCTITPQSMGGSAYVDMPIDINFSNDKKYGTVNTYKYNETITFTEA